jgi:hypothetical protein
MLAQIALGLHWPSDMLGGALLGGVLAYAALRLYRARGRFTRNILVLARAFDLRNAPYCYILYVLLLLGTLELALHFQHLNEALISLRAQILNDLAHG